MPFINSRRGQLMRDSVANVAAGPSVCLFLDDLSVSSQLWPNLKILTAVPGRKKTNIFLIRSGVSGWEIQHVGDRLSQQMMQLMRRRVEPNLKKQQHAVCMFACRVTNTRVS